MRPTERETGAVWRLLSAWAADEQAKDRLHRKITQGDMARMFGVSSQTISAWKLCQARMPMATQLRVTRSTGISLDQLTAALAEDEPRVAESVDARRDEDEREVMGNAEHPASTSIPPDRGGTDAGLGDPSSGSGPKPSEIVKRYLRETGDNAAEAVRLLQHDGADGVGTDDIGFVAALGELRRLAAEPHLLAVASGDEGDERLAREATGDARKSRWEQIDAIVEMKRKKKKKKGAPE